MTTINDSLPGGRYALGLATVSLVVDFFCDCDNDCDCDSDCDNSLIAFLPVGETARGSITLSLSLSL